MIDWDDIAEDLLDEAYHDIPADPPATADELWQMVGLKPPAANEVELVKDRRYRDAEWRREHV